MRTGQSLNLHQRLITLEAHPQFKTVLHLIEVLQKKGQQTVLAGGSVRDSLLGKTPKDLDVATAAAPDVVEALFERTLAVGKAFGTIVVILNQHNFEVTTFRREGPYADGRHPDHVEFTDMMEDAKRRDFTVNALFYDPIRCEVLDFVGGVGDLRLRLLRTVGDAEERFMEDRLRMLRAPRFVAQLGFDLDDEALVAIAKHHQALAQVSSERVFNEMKRLLTSSHMVDGLRVLHAGKLDSIVWPELAQVDLDRIDGFVPTLSWENAFAAVMLLAGSENTEARLRSWKASRDSLRRVQEQIDGFKVLTSKSASRAARMRVLGGEEFAEVLQLAKGFAVREETIQGWIHDFISLTGPSGKLPKPLVTGQDLLAEGHKPGEKMGLLLKALYEDQLEGKISSRAEAMERLKKL